ncbi:hypothetical protein ACFV1U_35875 [Streptomyces microflavus]|uniref:hypothetical protein n=1 Tax=Streptomyces microflavus TaxID=1919 RepID=UPI0036AA154C
MTTAVTRRPTVSARVTTPTTPTTPDLAPARGVFTATVYMNTHDDNFGGYQPGHPLAAATRPDGSPLRLVFHTSTRIRTHEAAASAAFDVGNHARADDHGQTWPSDIRPVSVGDVIKVTSPDHWILHLSVDPTGFTPVPEPATLTALTGSRATSSR